MVRPAAGVGGEGWGRGEGPADRDGGHLAGES